MKVTNNYNLPQPFYKTLASFAGWKPKQGSIGVTTLIAPPLPRMLKMVKWDEIEVDASEFIPILLGNVAHFVSEANPGANALSEEWLSLELEGMKITARLDRYEKDRKAVIDYKVSKIATFYDGVKPEWNLQLNIYAHLLRKAGYEVDAIEIHGILKDWTAWGIKSNPSYPKLAYQIFPVIIMEDAKIEKYLINRLTLHKRAEELILKEGIEKHWEEFLCSPKERWNTGTTYAVKKKGAKRATAVFQDEVSAQRYLEKSGQGYFVEVRQGVDNNCLYYCNMRRVCEHGKNI
jgi:hypothetical protein